MSQTQLHSTSSEAKSEARLSNVFARLISDIANPLVIPPFVIFITGSALSLSLSELGWITSISLMFFTLIPFSVTILLLKNGHIQSFDIPERKNRSKLFRYAILSSTSGSIILILLCLGRHPTLTKTAMVFLLNPVIGYLINRRFKISIHTGALATAGTLLLLLHLHVPGIHLWTGILSMFMFLVILPLMLWSRLRLGVHSIPELAGGILAGIMLTLLEISIMQIIW